MICKCAKFYYDHIPSRLKLTFIPASKNENSETANFVNNFPNPTKQATLAANLTNFSFEFFNRFYKRFLSTFSIKLCKNSKGKSRKEGDKLKCCSQGEGGGVKLMREATFTLQTQSCKKCLASNATLENEKNAVCRNFEEMHDKR